MKKKYQNFSLRIGLANDTTIRSWSFGEITRAETINYKTEKPVPSGLFCEKIFGPVKSNECACGKYQRIRYKGKVCEICEVTVTDSIVRRRRMAHIELSDPIAHVWYYRVLPSPIALLLDLEQEDLEQIISYKSFILTNNNGDEDLSKNLMINLQFSTMPKESKQYLKTKHNFVTLLKKVIEQLTPGTPSHAEGEAFLNELEEGESAIFFIEEFIHFVNESSPFKLESGAIAIETLIKNVDLQKETAALKKQFAKQKSLNTTTRAFKKLQLLNNFERTGQRPEWMVTRTIPVLPPELRPIVHIEGGRFATSGINRLYNDLIIRKNRLKKHETKFSPLFMINQLRALVQEAADTLFDKSLQPRSRIRRRDPISENTQSIADNLKGKSGRFRQNLLGKRVDFSAGSVIVGGPNLKLNECGLPRDIAVVLFRGAIIGELLQRDPSLNKRSAEKIINDRLPVVWNILSKLVKNYPVILNRAPTLHRLGVQGFYPKLIRGKAIQLHPLVTTAFNADFDGDRMPIHLPLTDEAKAEVESVLMSTQNILNPRNGSIILMPSQDIILGIYYLTTEIADGLGTGSFFANPAIAMLAFDKKKIHLHSRIFIPANSANKHALQENNGWLMTTVGKLIFNSIFESDFRYLNGSEWESELQIFDADFDPVKAMKDTPLYQPIAKPTLSAIVDSYFNLFGRERIVPLLDELKRLGFEYSTRSGVTISFFDLLKEQPSKKELYDQVREELKKLKNLLNEGGVTALEERQQRIDLWTNTKEKLESKLKKSFYLENIDSIHAMVNSGARGSISSVTQLVAMRGLMVNTNGEIIDTPIRSSLSEGLNPLEFFISTYGARKGMVDTALKTADSGYLTRRLVDSSHDVYTNDLDCGTEDFVRARALRNRRTDSDIISLDRRIFARVLAVEIPDPKNPEKPLFAKNTLITRSVAREIGKLGLKEVAVRSPLTCISPRTVCNRCFGLDLAKNELISSGQAVGVLAAQSIGEPATQLTMRTFHTGGVADIADITQGLPRVIELFDVVTIKKNKAVLAPVSGTIKSIEKKLTKWNKLSLAINIFDSETGVISTALAPASANPIVKKNDVVTKGDQLTEGSIDLRELLTISESPLRVADYIVEEVQNVYCSQGIEISDKYIEIIVRKMLSRCLITDSGDSEYIAGEELENHIIDKVNRRLKEENKKLIKSKVLISGTKRIASRAYSFLSAASFQETTKVLIRSVIENRIDSLYGLKENVIVGNLIPVGTGYKERVENTK